MVVVEKFALPPSLRDLSLSTLPCEVPPDEVRMAPPYPGYWSHGDNCDCAQCAFELDGQFFFCDFYSLTYRAPSDFHEYIVECLRSWASRSELLCMSVTPRVYGRVDLSLTCAGSRIYLYRFLVALPCKVKWTRLWEKMLYNAATGAGVSLLEDGKVREYCDVYPLAGHSWESFLWSYTHCDSAIAFDGAGMETSEGKFGNRRDFIGRCCSVNTELIGRM